jgi:outer membrane protein assembly factor BamB
MTIRLFSRGVGVAAVILLTTALLVSSATAAGSDRPPYADTSWTTLHAGPANRKYVDTQTAETYTRRWLRLQGAALTAAPSIGPDGHIYQSAGLGPGHSDLYAFDADGNLLWATAPWSDGSGLDSCAGYQTPIIDTFGDIYISDCNQLWAFHADGTLKWVQDLPAAPPGSPFQDSSRAVPVNSFVTAAFTNDGSVFGVTIFGQAIVVSRADGSLRAPILQLPGALGTAVAPPPASLWAGGGFIDPEIIDPLWQIAFAGDVVSANTPAVDTTTGRIFVVATAPNPAEGALYAIDFSPGAGSHGRLSIKFAAPVGAGSGSSPAISPDNKHCYVTDNNGVLYSVNTRTGKVEWTGQTDSLAQSVTVGSDGRVYIAGSQDMFAFDRDGTQAWHVDFSSIAASLLPTLPTTGPYALFSAPTGSPAGPMTITNNALVDPLNIGYTFAIPHTSIHVPIPVQSDLVAIDPATGAVERVLAAEADSAGANTPINAPNGMILAPHSGFTTLTVGLAPVVNPLLAPFGLAFLTPTGGLEALTPTAP